MNFCLCYGSPSFSYIGMLQSNSSSQRCSQRQASEFINGTDIRFILCFHGNRNLFFHRLLSQLNDFPANFAHNRTLDKTQQQQHQQNSIHRRLSKPYLHTNFRNRWTTLCTLRIVLYH